MASPFSIITLLVLLMPLPTESRLQRDPCFPCTNQRLNLHPLNVSSHLNYFIQTLQATTGWMSTTLEELTRPQPRGCDMEIRDEEYLDVIFPTHCSGNRLVDYLQAAFQILSEAANNITMANEVIADHLRLRDISRSGTHLLTPLCYLWESMASLGHYPTCPPCTTQLPPEVNRGLTNRCNYVFISYRRALMVAERVLADLHRPVVQSSNRQCYSNALW